ncbi:MAG: hypothetical protein HQL74_06000 [Magnetococcales bacterium]|nr:hypothetical protein [Magnetococcales bacterium]
MNQDRIGYVVDQAVFLLAQKNGNVAAGLLQAIPVDDLAEAMVQVYEDSMKVNDYSLMHVVNDVLSRALSFHGDSL